MSKNLSKLESNTEPYLSVGLDVGADFTFMSIALPNGTFVGKPFKITHANPESRELAVKKIKEAQEQFSLKSRCFLESTGIYHIPLMRFLSDKGFVCETINPIITKNSTNIGIRKVHNDKFDSKKIATIGLMSSVKTSITPSDEVVNLRNLVRDYFYFKDLQSAIIMKLTAELKVSFPQYKGIFSKITTKTSLKLLEKYPLAKNILEADKDNIVELIRSTARFGEKYAKTKYDALIVAAQDATIFGRSIDSNATRIQLYVRQINFYQTHIDELLIALHKTVDNLNEPLIRERINLLQTLQGVGFLSAVVLIAEMGSFELFSSPKKLFAYFGLDPAVKQSGKFTGDKVHMSKRGSKLARRVLHMIAINNLKVSGKEKIPVNHVIHDYYVAKCSSKKKNVAVGAVMHKVCNIIFAMLRDNSPFEIITPVEHCKHFLDTKSTKNVA